MAAESRMPADYFGVQHGFGKGIADDTATGFTEDEW